MGASSFPGAEVLELQAELARTHSRVDELNSLADRARTRETGAQEALQRQATLLLTIAHELRNPLAPLKLAAHMLEAARHDEAAHARLRTTIERQVTQMTRLIDDLVDGSRAMSGELRVERTLVELVPLLELAIETCRPRMDARRQRFHSAMPPASIKVLGDPVRLVQVFSNLLDNASKYTPGGGAISLEVSQETGVARVRIVDDGIGITEQALPGIFDMFVRDAHATSEDGAGLGIGLAVVRQLVRAHEGTVVARSAGKDRGSEFTVTLQVPVLRGPG